MDMQKKMLIKVVPDKVAAKEDFAVTRHGNLSREGAKNFAESVFKSIYSQRHYKCSLDFDAANDASNDAETNWVAICYDITEAPIAKNLTQ